MGRQAKLRPSDGGDFDCYFAGPVGSAKRDFSMRRALAIPAALA